MGAYRIDLAPLSGWRDDLSIEPETSRGMYFEHVALDGSLFRLDEKEDSYGLALSDPGVDFRGAFGVVAHPPGGLEGAQANLVCGSLLEAHAITEHGPDVSGLVAIALSMEDLPDSDLPKDFISLDFDPDEIAGAEDVRVWVRKTDRSAEIAARGLRRRMARRGIPVKIFAIPRIFFPNARHKLTDLDEPTRN